MRPFAVFTGAAIVSLWAAGALAAPSPFTFRVPEGWTDLSPGAPAANFAKAPPEMAAQAKNGSFAALAIDLTHVDEGFADNLNATVSDGDVDMTPAFAAEVAAELPKRAPPGSTMKVLESGVAPIGGVSCGRIVLENDVGGRKLRQLMYFLPHAATDAKPNSFATLTYTTTDARYVQVLPIFEASARATLGASPSVPAWRRLLGQVGSTAAIGGIIGAVCGAIGGISLLTRRRKRG